MFSSMNRLMGGGTTTTNNKGGGGKGGKGTSKNPTTTTGTSLAKGKRKADLSPRKGMGEQEPPTNKKRSALGDVTNAGNRKDALSRNNKDKKDIAGKKNGNKGELLILPPLTRSKSKSLIHIKEEVLEPVKKVSVVEKEVAVPEKVSMSKLPVRHTRSSSTSNVKREKEPEPKEEIAAPDPVPVPRRVTRSSHSKKALQEQQEVKKEEEEDASTEEEDNSMYKTAISTPVQGVDVQAQNKKNEELSQKLKTKLPDGVIDFDSECGKDPYQVGIYAEDIFAYYRRRETKSKFLVTKYLEEQNELNRNMRAILVDWMVEVQESFELNHETLYLAVKMVDLYLSKKHVKREALQLVGTTALYVAAKYDERCPPAIDDFCYICDDAYKHKEILKMEWELLREMQFDIGCPLSYRFLRRYSRCAKLEMETLTLARYILETSLMEYDFIDIKDSMIAAACLLLALVIKGFKDPWSKTLQYHSKYTKEELFDLTHRLHGYLAKTPSHLKTIKSKYSHKVFYEVAKLSLPIELKF